MAKLVFGAGTSHSPALNTPPKDLFHHAERDRSRDWHLDKNGNRCSFDDLAAKNPIAANELSSEKIKARFNSCNTAIDRLGQDLNAARLDALIIIGDDQNEQYDERNMPSILLYAGSSIRNSTLRLPDSVPGWWKHARSQFHEAERDRDYPVEETLANHISGHLTATGFDYSFAEEMNTETGEGHAFGFVHRRLMSETAIPVVPVILNTYYPPNQPRPSRCYALGQALRDSVESWSMDARVGVIASGGLSHFTVDEELDRGILRACRNGDTDFLQNIPLSKLNSGSSEIRNWIAAAGACETLAVAWQVYEPCYRTEAGTGCGMGFMVWR